jgi:hypothetical protein
MPAETTLAADREEQGAPWGRRVPASNREQGDGALGRGGRQPWEGRGAEGSAGADGHGEGGAELLAFQALWRRRAQLPALELRGNKEEGGRWAEDMS